MSKSNLKTVQTEAVSCVTRIEELTISINKNLETVQTTSLTIGLELIELKDIFIDEGKKVGEVIDYCKAAFGIGKAQYFKLVKVAQVFQEDKRFSGVAMRVLYRIATEATPSVYERAAELAVAGNLNSTTVELLLNPQPLSTVPSKKEEEVTSQATTDTVADEEEEEEAPFLTEEEDTALASNSPANVDDKVAGEKGTSVRLDKLVEQVTELTKALQEANNVIFHLQAEKKVAPKAQAPSLPQFDSKFAYVVLGMAESDAGKKTIIQKAFRGLIKCGYGESHGDFNKLVAAKDELLSAIQ